MTVSDALLILVTFAGPIVAVRLTRYLDDRKEIRGRKLDIFKTLMATRAYPLSVAHVQSLNRIDLEFSSGNPGDKAVIAAWQQYLDWLCQTQISPDTWAMKRTDLLVELLYAMARALRYDFDKVQIKNAAYAPTAHGQIEDEQAKVRQYAVELLEGKRVLPMYVTNIPVSASQDDNSPSISRPQDL